MQASNLAWQIYYLPVGQLVLNYKNMLAQQVTLLGLGYWTALAAPCRTHVSKLSSSAFFHLHNICKGN